MFNTTFLPEETTKTTMETEEGPEGRSVASRSNSFFMKTHVRTNCLRFNPCYLESKEQKLLPHYSTKTLYHPSFMSCYTTPGLRQRHGDNQTVHPMIPQEFFYTDPTMICGARIANQVNELRDFDCFQLNTPPPIMSASPAPPHCPDPFRTVALTRNLGSSSWKMSPKSSSVNPMWVVIQLTQEEDEAVTNLLTLHHGEGKLPTQQSKVEEPLVDCINCPTLYPYLEDQANELSNIAHPREAHFGKLEKHWSDAELEAANTLFTQFSSTKEDNHADFSTCSNLLPSDTKQNMTYFTDLPFNKKVLSKSEGDALCGLLSLGLTQTFTFQQ